MYPRQTKRVADAMNYQPEHDALGNAYTMTVAGLAEILERLIADGHADERVLLYTEGVTGGSGAVTYVRYHGDRHGEVWIGERVAYGEEHHVYDEEEEDTMPQ